MTYEARRIGRVEGLGEIYQVAAPLDEQLAAFAKVGIGSLAEPDEVARIRLANLSNDSSRTNVASIAVRDKKTILVRGALNPLRNPIMAAAAVMAHRKGDHFEMNSKIYEAAEAVAKEQDGMAPEDRDAIFVSQKGDFNLTPKHDESRFMLGKQNVPYFEQKTTGGIPFYGLSAKSKDVAVVNYTWFDDPQCGSMLDCRYGDLDYDSHAFGVLRSGEAELLERMRRGN